MKNITSQRPTDALHGRTMFCSSFVDTRDIVGKKCLDIGCGYGWMELVLHQKHASLITGMELNAEDLKTARKYIHTKNISFVTGSAIDLPFDDHSFDTVISWEVIEHIPKTTESVMLSEIYRVLKPKGVLYLSTPNRSIGTFFDPAYWLVGHRHYSQRDLIILAEKCGFSIEKTEIRGGWWEILWLLNLYICKWVLHRKPIMLKFFEEKQDKEYSEKNGFTNIFMRLNRIASSKI